VQVPGPSQTGRECDVTSGFITYEGVMGGACSKQGTSDKLINTSLLENLEKRLLGGIGFIWLRMGTSGGLL